MNDLALASASHVADQRYTERMMLDLLHYRYTKCSSGNGSRYVCAEHVKSQAGFDARRCADMIVQDLWASSGYELHGFEVKVSRPDWLAELKDPRKAEEFRPYVHRWWLVVPDRRIVQHDLPASWGLMAVSGGQLRVVVSAPRREPQSMPRTMQVALLRAVAKTATRRAGGGLTPDTVCVG